MTLWKQLSDYPALRAGTFLVLFGTFGVLVGFAAYLYVAPYQGNRTFNCH